MQHVHCKSEECAYKAPGSRCVTHTPKGTITMTTKTNATPKAAPSKKNLFGLSNTQLRLVVGGAGVIVDTPKP